MSFSGVEQQTSSCGRVEEECERWDEFFAEAEELPSKVATKLVKDFPHEIDEGTGADTSAGPYFTAYGREFASPGGLPLAGPCRLSAQVAPLGCRDDWEDELVDCPAMDST